MGISFSNWLKLVENEEQVELKVAQFLEKIIDNAGHVMMQDMQQGKAQGFNTYVRQFWPSEAIENRLVLPQSFPEGVAGQPVDFKYSDRGNRAYSWHTQGNFAGFVINMTPFRQAKTPEQLSQAIEALKAAVHHESEHIYNPGGDYQPGHDDDKQTLEYMTKPGEIRAHAREMAWVYANKFPGEPFDLNKAIQLLELPYFNETHKNYFVKLADPRHWQELSQRYGLSQNPHQLIVQMVQQFLPQYSRQHG